MKLRRLFATAVMVVIAVIAWAQPISQQEAQERAIKYLNRHAASRARAMANLKATPVRVEASKIYAFNLEGGGYVIASGDKRTLPVLGYGLSGTLDWDQMPENMRAWLRQYDVAISTLGDSRDFVDGNYVGASATRSTRTERARIEPLVKSQWNQDAPYWNKVPKYAGANPNWTGQQCPTGCVATSLAQILNYWQWPKSCPAIPAYDDVTAYDNQELVWHHDSLPAVDFDWANMLNIYDADATQAQQDAVATLMQYCGQAVCMCYTPSGSGTSSDYENMALKNYFGFPAATMLTRSSFGIDEWEDVMYNELASNRPIIYDGSKIDGGHSFICDGYDGAGLFHINWGWGGYLDDYFSLSVLNPRDSSGWGAAKTGMGYSLGQSVQIGLDPQLAVPPVVVTDRPQFTVTTVPFYVDDCTVGIAFSCNYVKENQKVVDNALGTKDADGKLTPLFYCDPADSLLMVSVNWFAMTIDSTYYQAGQKDRLYYMMHYRGTPADEWFMPIGDVIYVDAGRDADGKFFVNIDPKISVTGSQITADLNRIGYQHNITVNYFNQNNFDVTDALMLVPLYYGHIPVDSIDFYTPSEGDAIPVGGFLKSNAESEATFNFTPLRGGLVVFEAYSYYGAYFGSFPYEFSDTIYSYDSYLRNKSKITYDRDNSRMILNVDITDNPKAIVPKGGVPSDSIAFYAVIGDTDGHAYTDKTFTDDIRAYLKALPDSAGTGEYRFSYSIPFPIELAAQYKAISYFYEYLNDDECLISNKYTYAFNLTQKAGIYYTGRRNVASGSPLDLLIRVYSGYPYDRETLNGTEQVSWALYTMAADSTLTLYKQGPGQPLSFYSTPDQYTCQIDSMYIYESLPDGQYVLRITTDWSQLPGRDINVAVGATGISDITTEDPEEPKLFDLQGRSLNSLPARRGIYLNRGRKILVK